MAGPPRSLLSPQPVWSRLVAGDSEVVIRDAIRVGTLSQSEPILPAGPTFQSRDNRSGRVVCGGVSLSAILVDAQTPQTTRIDRGARSGEMRFPRSGHLKFDAPLLSFARQGAETLNRVRDPWEPNEPVVVLCSPECWRTRIVGWRDGRPSRIGSPGRTNRSVIVMLALKRSAIKHVR